MNILLWVLQVLLALHTLVGAVWKFSNSAQTVPSLQAIPHGIWLAMGVVEVAGGLALMLPVLSRRWAILAPIAAVCIGAEMLMFSVLYLYSSDTHHAHLIYWLTVMVVCAFIAYGRLASSTL